MEFNWWVGHLFGGLRNKFVLNVHSLKIWVVHQLVYIYIYEFCLTEILGNKIITLLSCPISLAIGFLFYSTLLILVYTKIQLHLATVCPSGPCTELPDLVNFKTTVHSSYPFTSHKNRSDNVTD